MKKLIFCKNKDKLILGYEEEIFMKIVFFSVRDDEYDLVRQYAKKYQIELVTTRDALTMDSVYLCEGAQAVSIMTTKTDESIIKKLSEYGVCYISTRTIGYDHIDLDACKKWNIHAGNVSYTLSSVAEYTVMMILMALRNMKLILERFLSQDFSLDHIRGRELKGLTVGIIGTGKIGQEVIRLLSVFNCKILAYDVYPNEETKKYAEYVDLETLYKEADVISLHAPAVESTFHMIDKDALSMMKRDVVIINTARGRLIDTKAFIEALEDNHIGYAALDVVENEHHLYYKDLKNKRLDNRYLAILRSFPNVMLTPHTAFFTHQAVSDMVEYSIVNALRTIEGKDNPWQLV